MNYANFAQHIKVKIKGNVTSTSMHNSDSNALNKLRMRIKKSFCELVGPQLANQDKIEIELDSITNLVLAQFESYLINSWNNNEDTFSKLVNIKQSKNEDVQIPESQQHDSNLNINDAMSIIWFLSCYVEIKSQRINQEVCEISCEMSHLSLKVLSLNDAGLNQLNNGLVNPTMMKEMKQHLEAMTMQAAKEKNTTKAIKATACSWDDI